MPDAPVSIGIAAVIVSLCSIVFNHRSQLYELARSLHQDLTTGAVQVARDHLGSIAHGNLSVDDDLDGAVAAYFRLLWCFERIEAGRRLMVWYRAGPGVRKYLDSLVRWHVQEWARNFGESKVHDNAVNKSGVRASLHVALSHGLQDDHSWRALDELVKALGGWAAAQRTASAVDEGPQSDRPHT